MALQDKTGIEKLVYKATAGDITIPGNELAGDGELILEKLVRNTSKGTLNRTGNKRVDFEIQCFDPSLLTSIEADEGNLNSLEIWQLGSTIADETIADTELIANPIADFDPESDTGGGFNLRIFRVFNG